jgi:hypothetical protein
VGKYAFSQECLCDDGVKVVGSGWMEQTGTSPIKGTVCFPLDAHAGTRIFAQKVTAGTSSKGLFFGEMTLSGKKPGGGNILRGIEQENGKYWGYHNLSFQFFDNQAIYISDNGSNVTWMNNIFCRDCVQASGLSGEVGAIHIQGQDNILGPNIEATTSSTSYAEGGKRIALLFDGTAASNIIVGGQYEISEIGIMVRGSGGNKFVGVRSDLNYGNGAEFRVGGNVLAACEFLNNGRNTTNTYDGVTFFAQNNVAAGCNARSTGAVAQVHKYGGRDASGAVGNKIRPFVSTGHGTAATHEDTATGAFSEELIHQELATADDATPDLTGIKNLVIPTNTARTEITGFSGKITGEQWTVRIASGNDFFSYINPGANFRLKKPFFPTNNSMIHFGTNDGTVANEISRTEPQNEIHTVRCNYDNSLSSFSGAIGDHIIGYIPINCIVVHGFYFMQQLFASSGSLATVALGIGTDDPAGLEAAALVTDPKWDLSNQGAHLANPVHGTVTSYTTMTTALRPIILTVAVEALTAGRIKLFLKYVDLT